MSNLKRRTMIGTVPSALAVAALAACGDDAGEAAATGKPEDLDAALEKGGKLTYWTWTPSGQAQADAFMTAHPNVEVEVVNAGTATDEYTALQNAVAAGSGERPLILRHAHRMGPFRPRASVTRARSTGQTRWPPLDMQGRTEAGRSWGDRSDERTRRSRRPPAWPVMG